MKSKLLKQFNNAQVIGITKGSVVKDISHMDSHLLHSMDFSDNKKTLGMLELFENAQIVKVPFLKELMQNNDYIYVNGNEGSFTYEIPMDIDYCKVIEVVEDDQFLGIDGSSFEIKASHPFKNGEVITYDLYNGAQMIVTEDSEVIDDNDGFIHEVTLVTNNREDYLDASKLKAGTKLFKVRHAIGEYGTKLGGVSGGGTPQKVKLEYTIGSRQGVEVAYTDFANNMKLNGEADIYDNLVHTAYSLVEGLEGGLKDKYLFFGQIDPRTNKMVEKTMKVEKLMHSLAMAELYKLLGTSMMFSQGATITGINGSKRINEGIYPQMRRGRRYTYRHVGELRSRIQTATAAIFEGLTVPLHKRKVKFRAGYNAYNQVREMFKDEFTNTLPVALEQDVLGMKLLSGNDRYEQKFETFAIGTAFLNGIGNVELEHDTSMDYDYGDMVMRGYNAGLSKRSYSLAIYDVTDPEYSNVYDKAILPKGVTIDKRASGKNLYMIKAEDTPTVSFGYRTGRMTGTNVQSSMAHMGQEFWCHGQIDAWIPDLGRVVLIEMVDALTEDNITEL